MLKITRVITSCIIFSWKPLNPLANPIRLAGTVKQYSKKAIPQLMRMAFHKGIPFSFRCQYQANVIKMLEQISKKTVRIYVVLNERSSYSAGFFRRQPLTGVPSFTGPGLVFPLIMPRGGVAGNNFCSKTTGNQQCYRSQAFFPGNPISPPGVNSRIPGARCFVNQRNPLSLPVTAQRISCFYREMLFSQLKQCQRLLFSC